MIATCADIMADWLRIRDRDCSIVVDDRAQPLDDANLDALLSKSPFVIRAEGDLATLLPGLDELPTLLRDDIAALVQRFMALMQVDVVRVRLEAITTNACKKVHADITDIRLITTYAGPGTDYAPHGADISGDSCCLESVPTGAIALFKGRTYAPDHPPCLHRSPPIEGSGQRRLVLVIDTLHRSFGSIGE